MSGASATDVVDRDGDVRAHKKRRLDVDESKRYVIGIDVGTRNLGVCVARDDALPVFKCKLVLVDMLLARKPDGEWGNVVMEERNVYDMVVGFVETIDRYLQRARVVGIEKQMRTQFKLFGQILHVVVSERYPSCTVVTIDAKFTRHRMQKAFGLQLVSKKVPGETEAQRYARNKRLSVQFVGGVVPASAMAAFHAEFTKRNPKNGKIEHRVDALEAMIIAWCLVWHGAAALRNQTRAPKFRKDAATNDVVFREADAMFTMRVFPTLPPPKRRL